MPVVSRGVVEKPNRPKLLQPAKSPWTNDLGRRVLGAGIKIRIIDPDLKNVIKGRHPGLWWVEESSFSPSLPVSQRISSRQGMVTRISAGSPPFATP